jgi:HMG (high mobility group) box
VQTPESSCKNKLSSTPGASEVRSVVTIQRPVVFAPKKPLSPFLFYSQEQRKKLKCENPEMHSQKVSKIVQHQWKLLSEEEKQNY